ncbi:hypothetical protein CJU90_2514 [Yarrowia sp. C11]|nr:hypothetical protein CKK34_3962 [Yarrowia sp. E02]KAG5369071.1 hypothetical protein CJU90_2514 [Yarrowia sp. C11]
MNYQPYDLNDLEDIWDRLELIQRALHHLGRPYEEFGDPEDPKLTLAVMQKTVKEYESELFDKVRKLDPEDARKYKLFHPFIFPF